MSRLIKILSFAILSFFLGAFAGAIVWIVLTVMNLGISFFWNVLPGVFEAKLPDVPLIIYNLAVCVLGGVIIGIWQKKYGLLPENMEQVMGRIKSEGSYPYDKLHIIAVSALLPLIFGGTLGPEAGLTGLIVGLCCFVGDRLKCKGHELQVLAETGLAASLGVIFGAPLFGIVGNLEPDNKKEKYSKKLADKKTRIFVYIMGVVGGMLAMKGLGSLPGGGSGLPRFALYHAYGIDQWKWIIPLIAIGAFCGFVYLMFDKCCSMVAGRFADHRIISCVIAGAVLAVIGYFLPLSMFSGETQLEVLMTDSGEYSAYTLIGTAFAKLFLVTFCVNFGWRGGNIFPIIFSGVAMGFAFAPILAMDGAYAVAIVVASLYGYISRKPGTVAAVLLLCFPLTYIIPIGISAFIASKIPVPQALTGEGKGKEE